MFPKYNFYVNSKPGPTPWILSIPQLRKSFHYLRYLKKSIKFAAEMHIAHNAREKIEA